MIFLHNRLASSFCLGMVLLFLNPSSCKDARDEIKRSLKGADVKGYLLATREDDNQIIISLTNGTLRNPVKLDSAKSLVLGYARVMDKKTKATKTLKAEVIKTDRDIRLHVTDIATNIQLINEFFAPRICPGEPAFDTFSECIDDFKCKVLPELQCEANRTCKPQFFHLECCLKDNSRIHALMFIKPTERRCLEAFPFDIDTLELIRE